MNPYIASSQDLLAYIRSPDEKPKSRPISGTPGLSFIKNGSRWSVAFEHNGSRFHGTLGTYPQVSMKAAKAQFIRKRFSIQCAEKPDSPTPEQPSVVPTKKLLSTAPSRKSTNAKNNPCFKEVYDQYFRWRFDKLKAEGTNKLPAKAVARMENLYHRYAASIIGDLPVTEISNRECLDFCV